MIVETKNFDLVDWRRENYLPNPGGLWAKVPTQGFLGGPALGRDRLWQASERSGCLWQPEDVASPGSKDLAAPSNEASLWPSAGAQAGWGLEKPLPALVADMAEGERAPSHELRGSWALVQGGRPGDPGQKFPRYRQSDVAPPAPCRQICCRVSSEGETLLSVHHPSIRQNGLAGLSSVFFPRQKGRAALHRSERCSFHRTRLWSGRRLAERRVSRCRLGGPNSRTGPQTIVQASPPRRGLAGRNKAWSGNVGVCYYITIL